MDYHTELRQILVEAFNRGHRQSKENEAEDRFQMISDAANQFTEKYITDEFLDEVLFEDLGGHNNFDDAFTIPDINGEYRQENMRRRLKQGINKSIFRKLSLAQIFGANPRDRTIDDVISELLDDEAIPDAFEIDCRNCGQRVRHIFHHQTKSVRLEQDGYNRILNNFQCVAKNLDPLKVEMPVPSGTLVIANDLRHLFTDENDYHTQCQYFEMRSNGAMHEADGELGMRYQIDYWLSHGMAYLFVGNSSPEVLQDDEVIHIGALHEEFDPDDGTEVEKAYFKQQQKMKAHGYVSTGLWAVTMMDQDRFNALCKLRDLNPEEVMAERDAFTVAVPGDKVVITKGRGPVYFEIMTPQVTPEVAPEVTAKKRRKMNR